MVPSNVGRVAEGFKTLNPDPNTLVMRHITADKKNRNENKF